MESRFLALCLNPVIQKTLVFGHIHGGEVNRALRSRTDASGKGANVARVLMERGASPLHLTHAGGRNRDWFLSLCDDDHLPVEWVDSGADIRVCITVIDSENGSATELVEEASPVQKGTEERLLQRFESIAGGFDVLIVSGTKAAGYSDRILPAIVARAAEKGIMTVLDIKGNDLLSSLPFRPSVAKPNLAELLATFPAPENADLREHVGRIALSVKSEYGTDLVVTRGASPTWYLEDGKLVEFHFEPVRALNPTGSGDAFTAGLAHILALGGSLREAIAEGSRMGARNALNLKVGSIREE